MTGLSFTTTLVTTMASMFAGASAFNQPFCNDIPSNGLDNVTSMESMFSDATSFNNGGTTSDITHLLFPNVEYKPNMLIDISNVTLNSGLTSDNTPLWLITPTPYSGVAEFKYTVFTISNTTIEKRMIPIQEISNVFYYTYSSSEPDVNNVITVSIAYYGRYDTNTSDNNYNNAGLTFEDINTDDFNSLFSKFEISNFGDIILCNSGSQFTNITATLVFSAPDKPTIIPNTSLASCFSGCSQFNSSVNWDISFVTDMSSMFAGASVFNNGGTDNTDITHPMWPSVTTIPGTLLTYSNFSQGSVLTMGNTPLWMFAYYGVSIFDYTWRTNNEDTDNIYKYIPILLNSDNQFGFGYITSYDNINTTRITVYYKGTDSILNNYSGCGFTTNQSKPTFGTIPSTNSMKYIATNCITFSVIQFGKILLTTGGSHFECMAPATTNPFTINLPTDITDVPTIIINTSLDSSFSRCALFDYNINKWDTTNVTNMSYMFFVSSFNNKGESLTICTSNVTTLSGIFQTGSSEISPDKAFRSTINFSSSSSNTVDYLSSVTNVADMFRDNTYFTNNSTLLFPEYLNRPTKVTTTQDILGSALTLQNRPNWCTPYYGQTIFIYKWKDIPLPLLIPSMIMTDTTNFTYDTYTIYDSVAKTTTITAYYKGLYDPASQMGITNYRTLGLSSRQNGSDSFSTFINSNCSLFTISQFGGIILSPGGTQFALVNCLVLDDDKGPFIMKNTSLTECFYGTQFDSYLNKWDTTNVNNMSFMFSNARFFQNNYKPLNLNLSNVTTIDNFLQNTYFNQECFSNTMPNELENMLSMYNAFYNTYGKFNNGDTLLFPKVFERPSKLTGVGVFYELSLQNTPNWFLPYYGKTIFIYTWNTTEYTVTRDHIPIKTDTNFTYDISSNEYDNATNTTTTTVYYKGLYLPTTAAGVTNYSSVGLATNTTVTTFINTYCSLFTVSQFGGIIMYPGGSQFTGITNLSFLNASTDKPVIMTNTSLASCFNECTNFNSSVNWDTSTVTNMSYMFADASGFNQIVAFNTTNVTTMENMFNNAIIFNNNDNVLQFITTGSDGMYLNSILNMNNMFTNCGAFNNGQVSGDTSHILFADKYSSQPSSLVSATNFCGDPLTSGNKPSWIV